MDQGNKIHMNELRPSTHPLKITHVHKFPAIDYVRTEHIFESIWHTTIRKFRCITWWLCYMINARLVLSLMKQLAFTSFNLEIEISICWRLALRYPWICHSQETQNLKSQNYREYKKKTTGRFMNWDSLEPSSSSSFVER